jgi:hypothetical protein
VIGCPYTRPLACFFERKTLATKSLLTKSIGEMIYLA